MAATPFLVPICGLAIYLPPSRYAMLVLALALACYPIEPKLKKG